MPFGLSHTAMMNWIVGIGAFVFLTPIVVYVWWSIRRQKEAERKHLERRTKLRTKK